MRCQSICCKSFESGPSTTNQRHQRKYRLAFMLADRTKKWQKLTLVNHRHADILCIMVDNDPSLPDTDDPNFYCRSCQHNFFFKDNYKKHLLLVHHYDLVADSSASSAFSSSLPDLHDPNFFCRVCQRGWKTYPPYRQHCKITHKMEVSPQRRSFYNAIIDPNDPKSYCAQCNRTYTNYRQHLKSAHNISTPAPSSSQ